MLSTIAEIKTEEDLIPPGAKPGTVPTDYIQATGLERLELIGKMQGIDIFDMRPLDASRLGMLASPQSRLGIAAGLDEPRLTDDYHIGTIEDPIIVNGAGDEQYAGCTGFPADSHTVNWLTVSWLCQCLAKG